MEVPLSFLLEILTTWCVSVDKGCRDIGEILTFDGTHKKCLCSQNSKEKFGTSAQVSVILLLFLFQRQLLLCAVRSVCGPDAP